MDRLELLNHRKGELEERRREGLKTYQNAMHVHEYAAREGIEDEETRKSLEKYEKEKLDRHETEINKEMKEIDQEIITLSEKKAERDIGYILLFDDENGNKKADDEELQKAYKRVSNLEDSLKTGSFTVNDNLFCLFKHQNAENVEGETIFLRIFNEKGKVVSEKKYINSSENGYEGHSSISTPKEMGKYIIKISNSKGRIILSHPFIIND